MSQETLTIEHFKLPLENGLYLEGEVRVPAGTALKPVLLLSHGFRGHKDWAFWPEVSARIAGSGFYTVSFNFSRIAARGADGISPEQAAEAATLSRELLDLEQLLKSLLEGRLPLAGLADTERIAVLGHSRAGGSNILFAAEHPEVKALVVWNGGAAQQPQQGEGTAALTPQELAIREDQQRNKERFNLEDALSRVSAAAMLIQGDQDREALLQQHAGFREQAPQHRYLGIRGADHTFGTVDPYEGSTSVLNEAVASTIAFLQEKLV
ncbi:alpha/beta hydrolase family protein [Paenibacillus piscarius]|uniref:alpha/beta hydrolase family protein n=1 Tax=Paenibacillus piscarius TaxID=1089681 RepID=UPI001EE86926|nr:dienelactone hydrolase family protein [Paenibacillus piscarius]